MGKKQDRLLSTTEAMKFLSVDWNAIYSYIAEGKLKAHKLGGGSSKSRRHYRIWYSDLVAFVNSSENEGESPNESLNKSEKSVVASSPSSL